MSFGTIEQLIAKGTPSPITSALQGFQTGAQIMPNIQMAKLAPMLRQAQIESEKAKASALPFQAAGSFLGGLGRAGQTSLSSNPSYIMARMVNSPALLALASKDKKFAKNLGLMMQNLGTQSVQQGLPGGGASQLASNVLNSIAPTGDSPENQLTHSQLMAPEHHVPTNIDQDNSSIVKHTKNADDWSDEDVTAFQQALYDALLKKTTTANIMNQRQYAATLDNLFNGAESLIPSVVKYAGFRGKTQKGIDAFKMASGETSPDYQNYLMFTRTKAPIIANEMRRALGGQASDNEKKTMDELSNPTFWDSNPKTAMKQWRSLVDTYRNEVNPALMASPSRIVNRFSSSQPFVTRQAEQKTAAATSITPTKATPTAPPQQMVRIRTKEGRVGVIPLKNLAAAQKKFGAVRF